MLSLNRYQWTVLLAAWLGWGFDIFDGLLFNFVAPNCVPTLLGLTIGTPAAKEATLLWTGILTSVLLVGWAVGGILFGKLADQIGRTRTLLLTIILYALGTASCAAAPNIWVLALCRAVASFGIGGEWAAGATMVAEVVPDDKRVEAGALLYTAAPAGLLLATFLNLQVAGVFLKSSPETSWRYVFLCGLIPAAAALFVRVFVKEPERWQNVSARQKPPAIAELFEPRYLPFTLSGFLMAVTALITWWSSSAFIPLVASGLAGAEAAAQNLAKPETQALIESWKATASNSFNVGGLLGTLFTIPAAKYLGRRSMFSLYFILSAAALLLTFGLELPPTVRLYLYFPIGLTVFGIFGSFTYYLPELFPTRLRATGAGFCYNIGRIVAAGGPFLVGYVAGQGTNSLQSALGTLFWVGFVPIAGLLFIPLVIETRGQALAD
ncbi:MFS transporter [Gloeobacter kilaueensis]|uniref:Major facilitator transporter n=1 Tax=Gloeobacter kilaueensis (strain ATCC BAA-2537 / CCAP 1431/1 / ULC 316 / JS1) TaxID=1183438 RepID=U5QPU0_GLOK1|nr:MFS transporter [Gloeobacter kilaueensis]AGY59644.1 major facilitator transporter [Gloeobacter kilaueensis JS1]